MELPTPPAESNELWEKSLVSLGQRSSYKQIWDQQARHQDTAKLAVAGHVDESVLAATARDTIEALRETVGIHPNDIFLEIGCGVARVGKPLSSLCLHWIGTDISGEMLKHAANRLEAIPNITLLELSTVGLPEIYDNTIDVVYCTVVFMHLYEWDRYTYVLESFRVLRPGGRCYFDNVGLNTGHGWKVFSEGRRYPLERRPAQLSMTSTKDELRVYLQRAGFASVEVHEFPNGFIAATGRKPEA